MKVLIVCPKCNQMYFEGNTAFGAPTIHSVPITDNGICIFTCERGHTTSTLFTQPKFEVLCEVAAQAIVDGYFRDAVASFAAALERAMEFYCRVIFNTRGKDDEFNLAWNPLDKSSERQFGFFHAVFSMENSKKVPALNDGKKGTQFRNKVVHKGYIPAKAETVEFGQTIVDLIIEIIAPLHTKYAASVSNVTEALLPPRAERPSSRSYNRSLFEWQQTGERFPTLKLSTFIERESEQKKHVAFSNFLAGFPPTPGSSLALPRTDCS
ncbi:hypothetical protein M2360_003730 [Rhizobium sp. SG_E_25_P2]|uniref:hypothetical protein n=1 Tax=Rhizobium sp. SG_E_25_P2 TaxID=2879942 RepID=UPI002475FBA1|nr:hypothetical protein [Rhizobium sp. SG_E_25_P2]MDH6268325.1 hypothetical protein [Rhizobium sp. SG_E_25_P2]